jgi:hypothetical protein
VGHVRGHDGDDLLHGQACAVGTVLRESAVNVGHRKDARLEGEIPGGQPIGIAAAVELFMVLSGNDRDLVEGAPTVTRWPSSPSFRALLRMTT